MHPETYGLIRPEAPKPRPSVLQLVAPYVIAAGALLVEVFVALLCAAAGYTLGAWLVSPALGWV